MRGSGRGGRRRGQRGSIGQGGSLDQVHRRERDRGIGSGSGRQGGPVILHHSRYADEDRAWLDAQVLGVIGLAGQRRGVMIVGTQTLEQSLDIDADLLVTDACPADVLLQRLGRLYRHRAGTPLAL